MTVREYIQNNLPFYHITPSSNLNQIIRDGLRRGDVGICVVRSDNPEIWREIINCQLNFPDNEYAIIKLLPQKHHIKVEDVAEDSVMEKITPLHNYIDLEQITIDDSDVFCKAFPKGNAPDITYMEHLVKHLEDYKHPPMPYNPFI